MIRMNKIITLVILALGLVSLTKAQEKGATPNVKFIPVYEKVVDDTIRKVVYDEIEVSAKDAMDMGRNYVGIESKQKVRMLYPKIIVTDDEIAFYAPNGKLKKGISRRIKMYGKDAVTEVFISPNGKYVGLRKGIWKEEVGSRCEFVMYNDSGERLWEVDVSKLDAGAYYISPNGEYFVAYGDPTGDFCDYIPSIWDRNGLRVKLFPEDVSDVDAYWICDQVAFSPDGERIVVVKSNNFEKTATAILYNKYGKKIWEKRIGEGGGGWRSIKVSPSGKYIAISVWETSTKKSAILLLDAKGNLLWKIPNINLGTSEFRFSDDEKNLVYINGRGLVHFIDLKNGKILWQFDKTEEEIGRFYVVATPSDFGFVVVGVYGHYGRADRILLFNNAGELLSDRQFENGSFCGFPLINVSSDGCELIMYISNAIKVEQIRIAGR